MPVAFGPTASWLKSRPEESSKPPTRKGGVWGTRPSQPVKDAPPALDDAAIFVSDFTEFDSALGCIVVRGDHS